MAVEGKLTARNTLSALTNLRGNSILAVEVDVFIMVATLDGTITEELRVILRLRVELCRATTFAFIGLFMF